MQLMSGIMDAVLSYIHIFLQRSAKRHIEYV